MMSLAMTPALAAGVSSIGETTLTRPSSIVTSMPRPPNSPRVCTCMSRKLLRVHVARMRIETGEHAVDRRFDQLGVVRLLDIVGAHALEHVAEQIELAIGVRGRAAALALEPTRTPIAAEWRAASGPRPPPHRREPGESCASSANLFAFAFRPPWAGIDGRPVLSEFDIENRLAGMPIATVAAHLASRFPSPRPVPRSARTGRDRRKYVPSPQAST